MKKYYKSLRYKKYNKRHSRKLFKRKLEYKIWKSTKLRKEQGIPEVKLKRMHEGYNDVNIPNQYSFLCNPNEVILKIKEIKTNLEMKKKTFINLMEVEEIDNGAITVLLSLMTDFKVKGVEFNGNFPKIRMLKHYYYHQVFSNIYMAKLIKNYLMKIQSMLMDKKIKL